uniref:MARVEL domain-containing protein n=1 Tax=Steinernema glaseri TaxID=37863 RepID=A0A1I8A205_9BILA
MACTTAALVAALLAHFKKFARRSATVVLMTSLSFGFILYVIGLSVFMINAEMLESRYLIGVSNVFEKSYGYSFFLACFGCMTILFSLLAAIYDTTTVFFAKDDEPDEAMATEEFGMLGHRYAPQHYAPQDFQQLPYPQGSDKYYAGSQYEGSVTTFNTAPPTQGGEFQQTTRTFLSY